MVEIRGHKNLGSTGDPCVNRGLRGQGGRSGHGGGAGGPHGRSPGGRVEVPGLPVGIPRTTAVRYVNMSNMLKFKVWFSYWAVTLHWCLCVWSPVFPSSVGWPCDRSTSCRWVPMTPTDAQALILRKAICSADAQTVILAPLSSSPVILQTHKGTLVGYSNN